MAVHQAYCPSLVIEAETDAMAFAVGQTAKILPFLEFMTRKRFGPHVELYGDNFASITSAK